MYFAHKELLSPPVKRAAYSDRTAWVMAEMSRLAYVKFEADRGALDKALEAGGFTSAAVFDAAGTQAFLATRAADRMAVLAFRGTEKDSIEDIRSDLNLRFYHDERGAKIHNGFLRAFQAVEPAVRASTEALGDHCLYVTGHSLGGALALIATRALKYENLAACYTFGSPRVGNAEFGDDIKAPIYRVVHGYDPVPIIPLSYFLDLIAMIPSARLQKGLDRFRGYAHHGDERWLTPGDDPKEAKVITGSHELLRLPALWQNRKKSLGHHDIKLYCEKLAQIALRRRNL